MLFSLKNCPYPIARSEIEMARYRYLFVFLHTAWLSDLKAEDYTHKIIIDWQTTGFLYLSINIATAPV